MLNLIEKILSENQIDILFQPIVSLKTAKITGFECLSRGPSDSDLITFPDLFVAAKEHGLELDLEYLCHRKALENFSKLNLPGKIFLNLTPESLIHREFSASKLEEYLQENGLKANNVVIELTEYHPGVRKEVVLEKLDYFHKKEFQIAMDDLGEGVSSLRLWLDLMPEFVKIDKYFVHDIAGNDLKQEFMRSISSMAKKAETSIIAEGIENQQDMLTIQKMGVEFGQGYYFDYPKAFPVGFLSTDTAELIVSEMATWQEPALENQPAGFQQSVSGGNLVKETVFVSSKTTNEEAHEVFCSWPALFSLPVVDDGVPVGMITRSAMIDKLARPYYRELYGKRSCTSFVDKNPLIIDHRATIQELSRKVVAAGRRFLINGYIITDNGKYIGVGTGHELMKKITEMQINAARYANPLTLLPGNVPLHQEIDKMINSKIEFICVYCDLDNFKPFNDRYGFERGDQALKMVGKVLSSVIDKDKDFLGHIGGDDFICLFCSTDWDSRCRKALEMFEKKSEKFFTSEDLIAGGYSAEDRCGNKVFHPLMTISLGAVRINPDHIHSHQELSGIAAEVKKMAKRIPGNSLYIERRLWGNANVSEEVLTPVMTGQTKSASL